MKQNVYHLGLLLLLSLMWGCGKDHLSGKPVGDETTNGVELSIVDPSGSKVQNARVVVMPSWSTSARNADTLISDSKGHIHLDSLPDGAWWFEILHESKGARVLVQAGFDSTVKLSNLGVVEGKAPAGSVVRLYGSSRVCIASAEETYRFDSLPVGDWTVRVQAESGEILQEALASVVAEKSTSLEWNSTLLADWTTWENHREFLLEPDSNGADSILNEFPLAISLENAQGIDRQSLRVIHSNNEFVEYQIEEMDSVQGKVTVWIHTAVNPKEGLTLHVVWGKNGLPAQVEHGSASDLYGLWHFGESAPYENANGIGPSIDVDTLTEWTTGMIGSARLFDGVGGMQVASPDQELTHFTISCWIRYSGDPQTSNAKVLHLGWPDRPFGSLMIDIDSATGLPALQLAFVDSQYQRIGASVSSLAKDSIISGKQWVHVAVTWNQTNGVARLYVDGVLQGSIESDLAMLSHLTPVHYNLFIGNQHSYSAGFRGKIDELRFETRERSPAWIQALHWTQLGNHLREK